MKIIIGTRKEQIELRLHTDGEQAVIEEVKDEKDI